MHEDNGTRADLAHDAIRNPDGIPTHTVKAADTPSDALQLSHLELAGEKEILDSGGAAKPPRRGAGFPKHGGGIVEFTSDPGTGSAPEGGQWMAVGVVSDVVAATDDFSDQLGMTRRTPADGKKRGASVMAIEQIED